MLDELFSIPTSTHSLVGEGKTTASTNWPPTSTDSVPKPPTNSQWTDYRSNAPTSSGTERDYFRSIPTKAATPISTPTKTATNRWIKSFTTTKTKHTTLAISTTTKSTYRARWPIRTAISCGSATTPLRVVWKRTTWFTRMRICRSDCRTNMPMLHYNFFRY